MAVTSTILRRGAFVEGRGNNLLYRVSGLTPGISNESVLTAARAASGDPVPPRSEPYFGLAQADPVVTWFSQTTAVVSVQWGSSTGNVVTAGTVNAIGRSFDIEVPFVQKLPDGPAGEPRGSRISRFNYQRGIAYYVDTRPLDNDLSRTGITHAFLANQGKWYSVQSLPLSTSFSVAVLLDSVQFNDRKVGLADVITVFKTYSPVRGFESGNIFEGQQAVPPLLYLGEYRVDEEAQVVRAQGGDEIYSPGENLAWLV